MDAERLRLRAIREDVPQLRELHVAVPFDQAGDVVPPISAAGFAFDREGWDAEVGEGVGVVSQWGRPLARVRTLATQGGRDTASLAASRPPPSMLSLEDRKPTLAGCEKRPGRSTSDNRGLARSFPALKIRP